MIITIWLAILKHDETVLYLVRETKDAKDFENLRNTETDQIFCGRKHFEKLDVNFDVVFLLMRFKTTVLKLIKVDKEYYELLQKYFQEH